MKSYKEIADNVLSRRDEFDKQQKIKRKKIIALSFVGCFVLVFVLSIGVFRDDWRRVGINFLSQEGNSNETTVTFSSQEQTDIPETQPTEYQGDEGLTSGGDIQGGVSIPVLPFDREIKLTGEKITDEEAQEYFKLNKSSIIGSLSSSGVAADAISISEKGYCHISYDGTLGKSFEIRENFRDYIVYNGDKIVAIITLVKENGEISATPSFGAPWFDTYNSYLNSHKDEELVYAYAGWFEIVIAPDNTYFNPMGYDASVYLEDIENPYDIFYHEAAVYVP